MAILGFLFGRFSGLCSHSGSQAEAFTDFPT